VRAAYARLLVNEKQFDAARPNSCCSTSSSPTIRHVPVRAGHPVDAAERQPRAPSAISRASSTSWTRNPDDERDPSKGLLILSQLAEERGDIKAAVRLARPLPEGDRKSSSAPSCAAPS
jgi:hypothetical protein